jgi:hypothetical protein
MVRTHKWGSEDVYAGIPDTGPPQSGVAGLQISCDLFAEDLGVVVVSRSADITAQPAPVPIASGFEAWCQSLTKVSVVDPIYDRSFHSTPARLHDADFTRNLQDCRSRGGVKLIA